MALHLDPPFGGAALTASGGLRRLANTRPPAGPIYGSRCKRQTARDPIEEETIDVWWAFARRSRARARFLALRRHRPGARRWLFQHPLARAAMNLRRGGKNAL